MSAQHAPGPWGVSKLSREQPRQFFVCRDISPNESFTHFEQLRDENGATARFETEQEAHDALAKVAGVPA